MISREAEKAFRARRLDSFNWMKGLSREELIDALTLIRPLPEFKTDPWLNQLVCFHLGISFPGFLFILDMAAGKTKIALDLISYFKKQGVLKQALVFASRDITTVEWVDQVSIHSDLTASAATGEIQRKREVLESNADVLITSYQGFALAMCNKGKSDRVKDKGRNILHIDEKRVERLCKRVNVVIFDEIHRLRNQDSVWFRLCRRMSKKAAYRYGLTGTPHGRNLEDLWSVFYLCDHGDTLGSSLGFYRAVFFEETAGFGGFTEYKLKTGAAEEIHRTIQHRSIRYSEEELGGLPERQDITIKTPLTREQREHYLKAVEGVIAADGTRERENAFVRMRQIVAGFRVWSDDYGEHTIEFENNPKVEVVLELLESMPEGEKMLIFCEFVRTGKIITDALKASKIKHRWIYGHNKHNLEDVASFKTDRSVRALVANSASGGESFNLQMAGYVVFYESPTSPIIRMQAEKRARRPGRKERVRIYDLIAPGTTDLRILEMIKEGRDLKDMILDGAFDTSLLMKDSKILQNSS